MSEAVPQNRADLAVLAELDVAHQAFRAAMGRWERAFAELQSITAAGVNWADDDPLAAYENRASAAGRAMALAEAERAKVAAALHQAQAALARAATADRDDAGAIPLH
jgi:hypothetical protein